MRTCWFLVALLVSGGARAEAGNVGVLAVDAHGLSAGEVETLADAIAAAAHELLPGTVLGPAEVRELLKGAGAKPAKKCKSKRCWLKVGRTAELGAVLATRAVGNKRGVALSFKWVDVAGKRITARHQQPIRKDVLTFADDARAAMDRLRAKLAGKIPAPVAPPVAMAAAPATPPAPATPASSVSAAPAPAVASALAPSVDPAPAPAPVPVAATVAMAEAQPPPASATRVSSGVRVWLGLGLGRASPGAVVRRVTSGGPGEAASLQAGDVIREWDGWVISTAKDVVGFALRTGPGRSARIKVVRGGAERMMAITPVELSDGAEQDDFEALATVRPASSLPLRPADSAPRGWPPPGSAGKKKHK